MVDNSKPSFSFGQASTANPSTSLFGQSAAPAAANAPGTGLFGSSTTTPGTGLFGSNAQPTAGGGSLFGNSASAAPTSNLFGGKTDSATSTAAAGSGSLFNLTGKNAAPSFGTSNTTKPGSIFGAAPTAQPNAPASIFGNQLTTPSKTADATNNEAQASKSIFGATVGNTSGSLFGAPAATNTGPSFGSSTAATPAGKSTNLLTTSTTPAGPPPGSSINTAPFSFTGTPAAPQAGGSSLFSMPEKPAAASPAKSGDKPSLFGNAKPQTSGSNLFGNLGGASQGSTEKSASVFGSKENKVPATMSSVKATAPSAAPAAFSFGQANTATNLGAKAAPAAASSSLFGAPKPTVEPNATATTSMAAPQTTTTASKSGQGGGEAAEAPAIKVEGAKTATSAPLAAAKPSMSSSTTGPTPPQQSRLKNKSMDEIITRWATDLAKYQKEFQAQAEKVARWDRMLVENSEKVQKLYGQTLEAERAMTEVERQLSAVETDQNELESWLDHYSREMDTLIKQQGDGEGNGGPDTERQKTYELAGRLTDKIDVMGQDLASMITEINDASLKLSQSSKADDPLSQVVRVLNTHLTQLQQIDEGATALSQKIQQTQRSASRLGSYDGGQSLASIGGADARAGNDFWKAFMGRR